MTSLRYRGRNRLAILENLASTSGDGDDSPPGCDQAAHVDGTLLILITISRFVGPWRIHARGDGTGEFAANGAATLLGNKRGSV
jgi:hypothetical protein